MNVFRKRTRAPSAKRKGAKKSKAIRKAWNPTRTVPASFTPQSGPGTAIKCTFTYCEDALSLDPGLGAGASFVFSASSLYDPNVTSTGHQPAKFDQLMELFEEYCVYGCKYKFNFQSTETTNAQIVGVQVSDVVDTSTDYRVYIENGNCQSAFVGGTSNNSLVCIEGYVDIPKMHGVSLQALLTDDVYRAGSGSSPSENIFIKSFASGWNTENTAAVRCYVELTYYCYLIGNKQTALS